MAQYIYGINASIATIKNNDNCEIFLLENNYRMIKYLKEIHRKFKFIGKEEMERLCNSSNHQGIVVLVNDFKCLSLEELLIDINKPYPLLLMLDGIEDPHNFGAILRTADGVGVDGVIISKHRSAPLNSVVAKVSTGAINYVKIAQVTNLNQAITKLKKSGFWIVGTDANTEVSYTSVDYKIPIVLVVGSEGYGISKLVLEKCDYKVKIPMIGRVSSLNVSVATAIILYQIYNNRII